MTDPRFFTYKGETYDERAKNPLKPAVEAVLDPITGSAPVSLKGVKTSFDITEKKLEVSLKGKLVPTDPEDGSGFGFSLDILTRGKAETLKKDPTIAKEFNIRNAKGFLRVKDLSSGETLGAVAFNLRTFFPIKLRKELLKGDFEAVAAKIDPDKSSFTGRRGFSGASLEALGEGGSSGMMSGGFGMPLFSEIA